MALLIVLRGRSHSGAVHSFGPISAPAYPLADPFRTFDKSGVFDVVWTATGVVGQANELRPAVQPLHRQSTCDSHRLD
jgi:hypothetical protein